MFLSLFPPRQLPLQIRDLFFGIRDLLFAFGNPLFPFRYLTAEFFVLSQQPLVLPAQLFTTGPVGVPMALCLCPSSPRAQTLEELAKFDYQTAP